MPAIPYATETGPHDVRYQIWVLHFRPAVFRPILKYWRFLVPSGRWRVIVVRQTLTIPIVVDARFFRTEQAAKQGVPGIEHRLRHGQPPWERVP